VAEKASRNLDVILQQALVRFKNCYSEHVRVMRARAEEFAARTAQEAAELASLKRRYQGVVVALRQRHKPRGKRFPRMPYAVTSSSSWAELGVIQTEYLKATRAARQRTKRGGIPTDFEAKAEGLLLEAHALVDQCCNAVHAHMSTQHMRFPVLPESDPRYPALAELNREQRTLAKRIKRTTQNDHNNDIRYQIDELFDKAYTLLASSDVGSTAG